MNTFKHLIYTIGLATLLAINVVQAETPVQRVRYSNSPLISQVASSTAFFDIPKLTQDSFTSGEREQTYFEYYKTNQVCIAIFPTPEYCLPKKAPKGAVSVLVKDLSPDTTYTVVYKRDNSINCITAPCPTNEFISDSKEFTTKSTISDNNALIFTKNFGYKSKGEDVLRLQEILIQKRFMTGVATGYFGKITFKAVKDMQKSLGISPTGFVGPVTRNILNKTDYSALSGVTFEGTVTAVSTGCFSDGECSISVDGKKIVTTIGWSQAIVGSVIGSSIGDTQIGSYAKVYARKVGDEFTLYGNSKYYIEILYFK